MAERFRSLFYEIDQQVCITPVNLGLNFTRDIPTGTDEILFSGGVRETFSANPELKERVFQFVRSVGEPILGVCFGAQAIARAHGARLIKLAEKRVGPHPIQITAPGDTFLDAYTDIPQEVYESHLWALDPGSFPAELQVMGISPDGVEAFAHRVLPQGGVQFHPERDIGSNSGLNLFDGLRKAVLDKKPKA